MAMFSSRPTRALRCLVASALAVALGSASASHAAVKALVGGRLIDGYGGPPLLDSVVVIDGERIVAVGRQGEVAVPAGAEVISTEGMDVLPGLWDCHVHLMIVGHSDYDHWDKTYPSQQRGTIMPAAAKQLLLAGVTSARELGAPLEDVLAVRAGIRKGTIPGPTLYVAGPFIQHEPYPGTEAYRWGVHGAADARAKVKKLADAGVDLIKLIDQDQMTIEEVKAVVEEAHAHKLPVIAHAHRPEEIRRGLAAGVDDFEHTGLGTAPEYPADVMDGLRARAAAPGAAPLYWTPTVSPLFLYGETRDDPERIDDPRWQVGLTPEIVADIRQSLAHVDRLEYFALVSRRVPTVPRKFEQLRSSGVTLLVGTDSGIPLNFHSDSTWREIDTWVRRLGVPAMDAIRAATYWPARQMKVDKDVGTVSEGKYADVIAVRGDVLSRPDLLSDVAIVIKHGERYK
jgi:imidazolonepropionase-like amidohydrolase